MTGRERKGGWKGERGHCGLLQPWGFFYLVLYLDPGDGSELDQIG